ncbi:acyltransferase-domain-containing protein [Roridomyces roridus]|uniref:Tafazzin family protein n=1 Tax=Roridomyces roridus TaxID=1738132 RepID=A0AAD7C424_9AGAR|nr:acyltransferase-domain-containing protein [Roridomyces roridus]
MLVVTPTVQLTCKLALNSFASVSVNGLSHITSALENVQQTGLLTLANHISTLDDPMAWGVLPTKYFLRSHTARWTLGASDIMFTNPLFSTFFRSGQVLETVRGNGIYQPSVDAAIEKLNRGNWVHLFCEGKVNQPDTYLQENGLTRLPRFKWGVGRVLTEVSKLPPIIPIWLSGFERLMPEGRPFPYKYLPRPGQHLSVTFGEPLDLRELEALRASDATPEQLRIRITSIVHDAVEALGHSVSGPLLTRTP